LQDLDSPPKGTASRGLVAENMKKMGKSDKQLDNRELKKPGWFVKHENTRDGFIARCC